ncbi:TolC family protein [Candidatus Methylacidithermus pantelleriae]|uniref:Putative Outer membrane protein TolC n=1 Tax=Candidatus Methylacidithermus pantelleriae TaxID=2744239 RepID=A0A8J2BJG8_9BACT|nr:TolC family protein [Candidatus Methylacidithermus pantelleriae]CAF0689532.1 putative Outer membrane protein TolC [Candidatus Methylacidithermus pantelleriae]
MGLESVGICGKRARAKARIELFLWLFLGLGAMPGWPFLGWGVERPELRWTKSVSLEDCYRQALAGNPDIRQARLGLEQALGRKIQLQARVMPRVGSNIFGGVQGPRFDNGERTVPYAIVFSQFGQPVFDLAILPSLREGRTLVAIAAQNLNQTVSQKLYEVRTTYCRALLFRELARHFAHRQRYLEANLKMAEDLFGSGRGGELAIEQARVALINVERQQKEALLDYRAALVDLSLAMGKDLGPEEVQALENGFGELSGRLGQKIPEINYVRERELALRQRPDLVLLRKLAEQMQEEKRIVEAGYFPTLGLIGSLQYVPANETRAVTSRPPLLAGQQFLISQLLYGAAMTWKVIDNGRVVGQARQWEAQRQAYGIQLEQLEKNVDSELLRIEQALVMASRKLEATDQAIALAQRSIDEAIAKLVSGQATELDFLKAESDLSEAQWNRMGALYDRDLALAQLDLLTGRYVQWNSPGSALSSGMP